MSIRMETQITLPIPVLVMKLRLRDFLSGSPIRIHIVAGMKYHPNCAVKCIIGLL